MLVHRPTHLVPATKPISGRTLLDRDTALFSPLERNPQSLKGWKKREADGVGLGIVAALEKARPSKIVVTARRSSAPVIVITPLRNAKAAGDFPVAEFLSCCNLCRKRLDGKDIYMYRGEKAFCSKECRYQQIVSDECTEKCVSGVLRPSEMSASPCSGDRRRLFFTGITVA
ncbi:uncharacterized protein LOC110020511 isoform X2 [Phalaenopsis equestris]|uniref:uncharacterized protein LOC110020511 isoform X2 n=1 Tax=Phalaenopsis equestris TaxID=78828 RepID=UPI0009E48F7D|nr:uncharacterized protein LOC110020511 isoform X2 [Phalaenopsis equestris]